MTATRPLTASCGRPAAPTQASEALALAASTNAAGPHASGARADGLDPDGLGVWFATSRLVRLLDSLLLMLSACFYLISASRHTSSTDGRLHTTMVLLVLGGLTPPSPLSPPSPDGCVVGSSLLLPLLILCLGCVHRRWHLLAACTFGLALCVRPLLVLLLPLLGAHLLAASPSRGRALLFIAIAIGTRHARHTNPDRPRSRQARALRTPTLTRALA